MTEVIAQMVAPILVMLFGVVILTFFIRTMMAGIEAIRGLLG